MRFLLCISVLVAVGCHSFVVDLKPRPEKPMSAAASVPRPTAQDVWQKGQARMKEGNTEKAIRLYQESLRIDSTFVENHLSLGAAFLAKGLEADACEHLGQFLLARPDHAGARQYYAELLFKQGKLAEAMKQFERNIVAHQLDPSPDLQQLVHCHGRVLDVGMKIEDDYVVHLHRGIGMYYLAIQSRNLAASEEFLSPEGLLFKAVAELTQARGYRPREARPCWYLYSAWRQLAQQQPANRWLREALDAAPFSYLTPMEQHQLELASRNETERFQYGMLTK